MRNIVDGAETAAATDASGVSAALSSRPEQHDRETDGAETRLAATAAPTTAIRITSSKRPGSATPPTEAAPPAAASVSTRGRRSCANR